MITIKNIRYGHANNSSSSHSLIFLGDKQVNDKDANGEFGWNHFTCASEKAKALYLLINLKRNFECLYFISKRMLLLEKKGKEQKRDWYNINSPVPNYDVVSEMNTEIFIKEKMIENFGYLFEKAEIDIEELFSGYDNYVDHQSIMTFPSNYDVTELNIEFIKQFFNVLLKYNFAFLGGNDNGDGNHPLFRMDVNDEISQPIAEVYDFLGTENYPFNFVAIYDEKNKDWILQAKHNGNKMRFSFERYENVKPTIKSKFPELVDLKITGFCDYGCKFCLTPDIEINTENGKKSISNIEIGEKVYSFNSDLNEYVINVVEQKFERDYVGEIISIELENGESIKITPNHKVFVKNKGWIIADILEESDEIIFYGN